MTEGMMESMGEEVGMGDGSVANLGLVSDGAISGPLLYGETPVRMAQGAPHGGWPTSLGAANRRGVVSAEGELRCGGARVTLAGRSLRLIVWLATHQERINQSAEESGQLWLTWKGVGPHSISGDIRTRL